MHLPFPANATALGPHPLQVDVGNERCFNMKPPGWHGWKLGVGTASKFGAGTNGDISVRGAMLEVEHTALQLAAVRGAAMPPLQRCCT